MTAPSPPIGTHRLLGQGTGAALIRPDGEVDWWCPNRFDAEPAMWSLLDPDGGCSRWVGASSSTWDGTPAGPTATSSLRVGGRLVDAWDGLIAVESGSLLVRLVRLGGGPATATRDEPDSVVLTRLDHEIALGGFDSPWVDWELDGHRLRGGRFEVVGAGGVDIAEATIDHEALRIPVRLVPGRWTGVAVAAWTTEPMSVDADRLPDLLADAERADRRSMDRVRLPHHHPSRATDALRVLHALTDPATGAQAASATTSLPEAPGGDRQFDYRYSWLRDSGLAVTTASLLGHSHAAESYVRFVAGLLDRHGEHLMPLTTTRGEPVPDERTLGRIAGWRGSQPVRTGNAASTQRQLDAVATVIEAVSVHVRCGGRMDRTAWSVVERLADLLVRAPVEPTSGIWEIRRPGLLTTEELARWVGLDRAVRLRRRHRPWRRRPDWERGRDDARRRVESALDPATGMLRQMIDDTEVVADAATLLAALTGFFDGDDPVARRLVRATVAALERGPFLLRYLPFADGFTGTEGAFIPASWWAVGALAVIGDVDDAERRADAMCAQLPPLQPEEWDVEAGEGLGNTPLLWSHMEAARALSLLQAARIRQRYGRTALRVWRVARSVRLRAGRSARVFGKRVVSLR